MDFPNSSFLPSRLAGPILYEGSVDLGFDFPFEVLPVDRLNFTGDFQRNASALRDLDCEVSAFDGRDPADEAQILLFLLN